jgi:hypothetical protein
VPVQPIILAMQEEPGMFDFYRNSRSFLNVHCYASQEQLIVELGEKVIRPAELKALDLQSSTPPPSTITEYLREAGWRERAIGAATAQTGAYAGTG